MRLWVEISITASPAVLIKVSLFVRLWVEIQLNAEKVRELQSASSWGCELKYKYETGVITNIPSASSWGCELKWIWCFRFLRCLRQPLREAVSWNSICSVSEKYYSVSLFVRLWVEIFSMSKFAENISSASSWGCELKYDFSCYADNQTCVSLFVRLWVEIVRQSHLPPRQWPSASSWGCELK